MSFEAFTAVKLQSRSSGFWRSTAL